MSCFVGFKVYAEQISVEQLNQILSFILLLLNDFLLFTVAILGLAFQIHH